MTRTVFRVTELDLVAFLLVLGFAAYAQLGADLSTLKRQARHQQDALDRLEEAAETGVYADTEGVDVA